MRTNPARRRALVDAALEVLADRGGRGLTFRAVDEHAGVPPGTASNYFADRDDLLAQAGEHLFVRLAPDEDEVAERMAGPHDRALEAHLMGDLLRRVREDPRGFLAMLELRLEARRRPAVQRTMSEHYRRNLLGIIDDHVGGGFPGDATTATLLYLAMTGLILEYLTLPEVLTVTGRQPEQLVVDLVEGIVPET